MKGVKTAFFGPFLTSSDPLAAIHLRTRKASPQAEYGPQSQGIERGSQDSNLESPVLEAGDSAHLATSTPLYRAKSIEIWRQGNEGGNEASRALCQLTPELSDR